MKANSLLGAALAALFILTISSCKKEELPPDEEYPTDGSLPVAYSNDSTWSFTAGWDHPHSFGNHHYSFTKNDNDSMIITLDAEDENVIIWLYETGNLNSHVAKASSNVKLEILEGVFNNGEYLLIVGTKDRGETDSYNLKIQGDISNVRPAKSTELISNEGSNFEFGGGGTSNTFQYSPRNEYYRMVVDENNSWVDLNATCEDESIKLYVLNALSEVQPSYEKNNEVKAVSELDAGEYTVIVSSIDRGNTGSEYELRANGMISKLERIEHSLHQSGLKTITDGEGKSKPNSPAHHSYKIEVGANNSYVDFKCSSSETTPYIWVFNSSNGSVYETSWAYGGLVEFVAKLDAGSYTVIVGTMEHGDSGSYNLEIVGNIAEFE